MAEPWTVRRVIAWMQSDFERRGIESARLDADLLVAYALGQKRIALYLDLDRPLMEGELAAVRKLLERRRVREPIAYILGEREFYGRPFEVTRDVLIPRPDTETLVEAALRFLRANAGAERVVDVCTGSGAIAVTLAAELAELRVLASDVSAAALAVAARNAQKHGVSGRVELREGDLFLALPRDERFRCITINPPYIGADELPTLAPDVRDFEPKLALDAGTDALSFYRRIAADVGAHLAAGGALLVEVGMGQAEAVAAMFRERGLVDVRTHRDLGGIERVVEGRQAATG